MKEYYYYQTEHGNILEKSIDEHPVDKAANPKNPVRLLTNELPADGETGIYQEPLDDLTPDDYREQGYAVVALYTEREQQEDPETGEIHTVITRQEILPLPKYGSGGPLPQYNELLIRQEVPGWDTSLPPEQKAKIAERNEPRLKQDWENHQLITQGKMYQVIIYDIYGHQKEAIYHNIREQDLQRIRQEDKIRSILPSNEREGTGGYPDFQTFQRKYRERFGLEKPMFLLSHPTLQYENGVKSLLLDMNINPARKRDLGKTGIEQFLISQIATQKGEEAAQQLTESARKGRVFWNVRIVPSQLSEDNPAQGIQFEYQDLAHGIEGTLIPSNDVPKSNANPNRYQPLFSLRNDIALYAEKISYHGQYTGKSLSELGTKLASHAIADDFDLNRKWQERRIAGTCKDPEFLEQVLRSGHALYNRVTKDAIVPVISEDGELQSVISTRLAGTEKQIKLIAEQWEKHHRQQSDYPEPVKTYVLDRLDSFSQDQIPPEQLSALCRKITFFPETPEDQLNHREEFPDTVIDPQSVYRVKTENAGWGLDTMDRVAQKDWSQRNTPAQIEKDKQEKEKWDKRKAFLDQEEQKANQVWELVWNQTNIAEEDFLVLYHQYQRTQKTLRKRSVSEQEKQETEQNWESAKACTGLPNNQIETLISTYRKKEKAHNRNVNETDDHNKEKEKRQFSGDIVFPKEMGIIKNNIQEEEEKVKRELYQTVVYHAVPIPKETGTGIAGYRIETRKSPEEQQNLQNRLKLDSEDLLEIRKSVFRNYAFHHHRMLITSQQARQYQLDLNLSDKDCADIWIQEGIADSKEMFPKEKKEKPEVKGQISLFSLPEIQVQKKEKPFFDTEPIVSSQNPSRTSAKPNQPSRSGQSGKRNNRLGNGGL